MAQKPVRWVMNAPGTPLAAVEFDPVPAMTGTLTVK